MTRVSTDDARIGTSIADRYRLDRVIGKGGMGTVYEGVHLWTHRPVAVKLLAGDHTEMMARRLLAEARAAAAIRHPHLVEVLDVGIVVEEGLLYLVLELLDGESLHDYLTRRVTMRAQDALDVVVPLLDALGALHRAKVLHRDIKPGNVFLSKDGRERVVPKLLDLGISKRLDAPEALTTTGTLMGTPSYMSPEQARGMPSLGPGVDIWAVGVLLFECVTGQLPFEHPTVPGLLHQIATGRAPALATLRGDLPEAVAAAVDRALAYHPADRHASAEDFADALVNAAREAGWPLTCHAPSGPMISLAPSEPTGPIRVFDPTPLSDPDLTPYATPSPRPGTPAASASHSIRATAPTVEAPTPVTGERPPGVDGPVGAPETAPSDDDAAADEAPSSTVTGGSRADIADADLALPLRSRRAPFIAAAAGIAVAIAGGLTWLHSESGEEPVAPATTAVGADPSPPTPPPREPVDPPPRELPRAEEPTALEPALPPATVDPPLPRARRPRAGRRPTTPEPAAPIEPSAADAPRVDPVRVGPNGAPIIVDRRRQP